MVLTKTRKAKLHLPLRRKTNKKPLVKGSGKTKALRKAQGLRLKSRKFLRPPVPRQQLLTPKAPRPAQTEFSPVPSVAGIAAPRAESIGRVVVRDEYVRRAFDLVETKRLTGLSGMRGITALARQVYYPKYTFATDGSGTRNGMCGSKRAGMKRGRVIDSQIGLLAKSCDEESAFTRLCPAPHPFTCRVRMALRRCGFLPIATQVRCADPNVSLHTYADLLCVKQSGELVIIELKTGGDGYVFCSTQLMQWELRKEKVNDAVMNQYFLQAALTAELFKRQYGLRVSSYVVRVSESGAFVTQSPAWATRVAPRALTRMGRAAAKLS